MPSEQRKRADRLTAAIQELSRASDALMQRTGGRSEDAQAINRLIQAVRRQNHAIMTVVPGTVISMDWNARLVDLVAGQIYHDPDDPRPCFRCGGDGIDPWFSDGNPGSAEFPEPPVLEPCVACQWGPPPQEAGSAYPARVRMNHTIHAAQRWPDDPAAGAPLTACKSTVYRRDWYGDPDLVATCGPCRQVLGID